MPSPNNPGTALLTLISDDLIGNSECRSGDATGAAEEDDGQPGAAEEDVDHATGAAEEDADDAVAWTATGAIGERGESPENVELSLVRVWATEGDVDERDDEDERDNDAIEVLEGVRSIEDGSKDGREMTFGRSDDRLSMDGTSRSDFERDCDEVACRDGDKVVRRDGCDV